MIDDAVEKIANAVLYEGYMLYPYRPSAVKNRQRFNFGVLYPREYCEAQTGADNWQMQTECLVLGSGATSLEVRVRFLQMVAEGTTNVEIADLLSISSRTVEIHRANVMRKLNLKTQSALVRFAVRKGIIPLEPE